MRQVVAKQDRGYEPKDRHFKIMWRFVMRGTPPIGRKFYGLIPTFRLSDVGSKPAELKFSILSVVKAWHCLEQINSHAIEGDSCGRATFWIKRRVTLPTLPWLHFFDRLDIRPKTSHRQCKATSGYQRGTPAEAERGDSRACLLPQR